MSLLVQGNKHEWEVVIGMEVHAQIATKSKLFSGSSTLFGAAANNNVSFVDAAMPGMLPVINQEAVTQAIRTGLAINAQINKYSVFDRKNYFYADLPQGYQISQFSDPIVGLGSLDITTKQGGDKTIGITRIHLEQDAGKSLHDQNPQYSYIDLNRAGVPLMEIVSEPDIRSSEEAGEYIKKLRSILRYVGSCDADMEKGMMRADANVSIRLPGNEFGTRCEIKNLNSVRNMIRAIDYEVQRQIEIVESGGTIDQETRLFDVSSGETKTMRSKEDAHDYRYFPDPDLLPLILTDEQIEQERNNLPEMPDVKQQRYKKDFGLNDYDAGVLTSDKDYADYYEAVLQNCKDAKLACTWITGELFGRLNKAGTDFNKNPINAAQMAELISLIEDKTISGKIAKDILDIMFAEGGNPGDIVEAKGLKQVTDTGAIEKQIDEVLAANQDKVEQYKSGKDKLFGFFVGQVMKATQGKANPQAVNEILKQKLS